MGLDLREEIAEHQPEPESRGDVEHVVDQRDVERQAALDDAVLHEEEEGEHVAERLRVDDGGLSFGEIGVSGVGEDLADLEQQLALRLVGVGEELDDLYTMGLSGLQKRRDRRRFRGGVLISDASRRRRG